MNTNRIYLLTLLIVMPTLSVFAQRSESSLDNKQNVAELEKNMSFKIIRFSVYGINTPTDALNLKNSMESKLGIISCETDIDNGICTVFAGFGIQRKDIVNITGPAGIKISDYSQEIHLKISPVVNTRIDQRQQDKLNERRTRETNQSVNTTPLEEAPKADHKKKNYQDLNTKQKIKHIEELKNIAVQKGNPTDKYDSAIEKLKNE